MQFLSVTTILALAGFSAAQSISETGLVCYNLQQFDLEAKTDPTGMFVIEPSLCANAGGKLYANDIICCLKDDSKDTFRTYNDACGQFSGTYERADVFAGGKEEIVPAGWKCPK